MIIIVQDVLPSSNFNRAKEVVEAIESSPKRANSVQDQDLWPEAVWHSLSTDRRWLHYVARHGSSCELRTCIPAKQLAVDWQIQTTDQMQEDVMRV